jgi:hypothetical protein
MEDGIIGSTLQVTGPLRGQMITIIGQYLIRKQMNLSQQMPPRKNTVSRTLPITGIIGLILVQLIIVVPLG